MTEAGGARCRIRYRVVNPSGIPTELWPEFQQHLTLGFAEYPDELPALSFAVRSYGHVLPIIEEID